MKDQFDGPHNEMARRDLLGFVGAAGLIGAAAALPAQARAQRALDSQAAAVAERRPAGSSSAPQTRRQ